VRRRVVVTGMGVVCPLGSELAAVETALRENRSGIRRMDDWDAVGHMLTRLGAPADVPEIAAMPRKMSRLMGRVALLATVATQRAIADAGLDKAELTSGKVGLAHGSTHGSSSASEQWARKLIAQQGLLGLSGTSYLKFMSHTTAANLALQFGIRGRIMTTCAACVSASQAIGYAYEAVRNGAVDVMICGGAEELHFSHAAVFDVMHATSSRYNDEPDKAPRPFDRDRDGLVVGEGAGTFVLEEYARAKALGKTIHAEVLGFATNCDGTSITSSSRESMRAAIEEALADARLAPSDVGYVNAHATATDIGDVLESHATHDVFGDRVPVSSLKGHIGHTLGACGAIEAALGIRMMHGGFMAPTRNLENPDPRCAALDYVRSGPRQKRFDVFLTNKFGFGGINTSLVFGRV
jgi:3-oxoacyl-[acyl-carrier-protein] synthase II